MPWVAAMMQVKWWGGLGISEAAAMVLLYVFAVGAAGLVFARVANRIAWRSMAGTYDEQAYAVEQARWVYAGIAADVILLGIVMWAVIIWS